LTLNKNGYSPTKRIIGHFEILEIISETPETKEPVENSDFTGKYALSEREFTDAEKQMIPSLQDWYIIPPEVIQICRHAKMTTESTLRMRNFMLRGPSGTGKTEGARAAAAGFGLPYVYITCSANTEITDLLGQILPDVKTDADFRTETPAIPVSYPTLDDIRMDPSTAYYMLTGIYDESITENDVYIKLIETVRGNASDNSVKPGFRYIDTALVNAIRYGWVCEIQEPSIIANPGVLVGLNALLDNCNTVALPTGEVIKRHPDAVICVTTNNDYSGCKKLNQSVISRMDLVFDVDEPDIDTMTERVMKITKCGDRSTVRLMAETVKDIAKHCRQEVITDGCCGMRELIAWVQSYMISGSVIDSAKYTILPSVSGDRENRDDIYRTCLQPRYPA
ncbi:MAG: AAA family ATPase, partial [Oscillospiraceae bacterium]|nr:AAA family ATPase [Oscillospiraceae bacterium]